MDSVQISDNGEDEFIYRIAHPFCYRGNVSVWIKISKRHCIFQKLGYNQKTIIYFKSIFFDRFMSVFQAGQKESGSQERSLYELSTICECSRGKS